MTSAEVVCLPLLANLSIEANRADPDQSSLVWVHTSFHKGFLNISADKKSRRLLLRLALLRVK